MDIVSKTFCKKTRNDDFPQTLREVFLPRINSVNTATTQVLKKVKKGCNESFYKRIVRQLVFKAGDLVYLDKPSNNQRTESDGDPSRKLHPTETGLYEVQQIKLNTAVTRINYIDKTVSLGWLSIATRTDEILSSRDESNVGAKGDTNDQPPTITPQYIPSEI